MNRVDRENKTPMKNRTAYVFIFDGICGLGTGVGTSRAATDLRIFRPFAVRSTAEAWFAFPILRIIGQMSVFSFVFPSQEGSICPGFLTPR